MFMSFVTVRVLMSVRFLVMISITMSMISMMMPFPDLWCQDRGINTCAATEHQRATQKRADNKNKSRGYTKGPRRYPFAPFWCFPAHGSGHNKKDQCCNLYPNMPRHHFMGLGSMRWYGVIGPEST